MARIGNNEGSAGAVEAVERELVEPLQHRPLGRQLMSDGAAEYLDILPDVAGRRAEQDPYPRVVPQSPFSLVFAADRWDVLEDRLVPQLYRLSYTPGSNSVVRGGSGPDPSDALASIDRQGHYALPWQIGGGSYLRAFQVGVAQDRKTGQAVKVLSWHTRWEQLYAGSEHIQTDTVGYAAWLADLLDRGLLPRPRPYVIERIARFYEQRLHKALAKAGGSAEIAELYRKRLGVVLAAQQSARVPSGPPVEATEEQPALDDPALARRVPVDDLEPLPPPAPPPPRRGRS